MRTIAPTLFSAPREKALRYEIMRGETLMFKQCTAQEIQPIVCVLLFFMLLSPVASTDLVVNPDGSDLYVGDHQSATGPAVSQESITVNFNDLEPEQGVSSDRYINQGLIIETGPSSTTSGVVVGSLIDGPCDGTRSIKTQPFTGPSFLLSFPEGVTSVSLDAGDIGPSDSDVITVKAFSDASLKTPVGINMALIAQGAPTGCVRLSVQVLPPTIIKAVEITSESVFLGSSSYPNSIFIDNVTFE
jgi:hypothetical protein